MPAIVFLLASFPNSRIKTRNPTSAEFTPIVTLPPGVATMVQPIDLNRTFLTLRNLDSSQQCFYGFAATIDGTVANGGFLIEPLEAANGIPTTQAVWVFNPGPLAMNVALDYGDG
jgi:hypothetical protein